MFQRSWVRIPAPYTGWTFFTYCKNCNVCLKRPKINEKEAGVGPLFIIFWVTFVRKFVTIKNQKSPNMVTLELGYKTLVP